MFPPVYCIVLYEETHSKCGSAFNFKSLFLTTQYYSKRFYSDTFYIYPEFSLQYKNMLTDNCKKLIQPCQTAAVYSSKQCSYWLL
jgi:hypothetical protein